MLITKRWDDVDVYDNNDMRWDDDIEKRWYWCWEYHWKEMMLMLLMILRWDDVDDDNDIKMR